MQRYVSESIDNPTAGDHPFARADLVFYGVDHSGPSFEARVFLNEPDADVSTARDDPAFAGSFTVFGHAGCAGDVGHCEVPTGPRDPFDRRPPHALTPQTKTVIVTEALRRVTDPEPRDHDRRRRARRRRAGRVRRAPVRVVPAADVWP